MRDKDTEHLTAGQLDRFFAGELGREEVTLVVRHLLTQCKPCQEFAATVAARYGFYFGETAVPISDNVERRSESFSDIFLKLLESRGEEALEMARERLQGIGLLSELEKHESGDRFAIIRTDPRFHHWGLFDRMLVKYLEYSRNSPEAGIQTVLAALRFSTTYRPDGSPTSSWRTSEPPLSARSGMPSAWPAPSTKPAWPLPTPGRRLRTARAIPSRRRTFSASKPLFSTISANSTARPDSSTGRLRSISRWAMTTDGPAPVSSRRSQ